MIKAVSWRRLGFHDIVIKQANGRPGVFAVILDRLALRQGLQDSGSTLPPHIEHSDTQPNDHDLDRTGEDRLNAPTAATSTVNPRPVGHPSSGNDLRFETVGSEEADALGAPGSTEADLDELSGQVARVSISHDGDYATAVCMAAEDPMESDVGGEAAARELW